MKKILTISALAAVLAVSAQAKFEGAYTGVAATYKKETVKLGLTTAGSKASLSASALGAAINGGYGVNLGSVYLGGELQLGYNGKSSKKTAVVGATSNTFKIRTSWNALLNTRIGGHIQDNWLGYASLGLSYETPKFKQINTNNSKTIKTYSVVPGFGTSYMFSSNMYLDVNYKYAFAIKQTKFGTTLTNVSSASKAKSHTVALGVGYQF